MPAVRRIADPAAGRRAPASKRGDARELAGHLAVRDVQRDVQVAVLAYPHGDLAVDRLQLDVARLGRVVEIGGECTGHRLRAHLTGGRVGERDLAADRLAL